MKKSFKGFTLIELLAVIVILAIIALIATPIILNVIERSRKSAAVDSTYGYIEAIEKQNALAAMSPDKYTAIADGTDLDISSIQVNVKGEKPSSGKITIGKGRVTSASVCVKGYTVAYDGQEARVEKKCNEEAPATVSATDVGFTPSSSEWNVNSVQGALDYLYQNS